MKLLVGLAILASFGFAVSSAGESCAVFPIGVTEINSTFSNLYGHCEKQLFAQIKREIEASYKYFQIGAYFAQDQVNLPGFSELFFNAAKEERDHGAVLMNYLSMRMSADLQINSIVENLLVGDLNVDFNGFSGEKALKMAHSMERTITKSIKNIITECDQESNDPNNLKEYHVSDFLTGDFLTEQYNSERSFAGKFATLQKMSKQQGSLAEFLFDKTL